MLQMAFLPFVCVLAAGAVARADDLTSVDLREEVVSLRKQNAALTHRLAALEAARRDLRSDCADSTSWYYDYNPAKNCEAYVSKKSKNCKKKDEFKVGRSALARRQKLVTVAHRRSRAKTPAR